MSERTPISEISRIVDADALTPGAAVALAHLGRSYLVTQAQRRLRTSARDYVAGIGDVEIRNDGATVEAKIRLTGALPNMVEHGAAPWDLRTTVLASPRAKVTAAGHRYMSIPFRHMGPDATGRNAAPMGSHYDSARSTGLGTPGPLTSDEARKLGRAVWSRAKRLKPGPGGGARGGERLGAQADPLRPRHVMDPYQGMTRSGSARQTQYMTFRTISTNPATMRGDAGGMNWRHPGVVGRRLFRDLAGYIDDLIRSGRFDG
ncbi:MAG: hypothetical protein EKK55_18330 [Rhodocyclaceae bacterium]|nr:MAG: hypothetical protein EKK55_18330 [Rhodocyclaceae bacterium]